MVGFPRESGELATPIRVPTATLGFVRMRRQDTGLGSVLLGDDARFIGLICQSVEASR
jgi:hypothetical protein